MKLIAGKSRRLTMNESSLLYTPLLLHGLYSGTVPLDAPSYISISYIGHLTFFYATYRSHLTFFDATYLTLYNASFTRYI